MAEIAAAAAADSAASPLVSPPRSPLRSGISVAVAASKFKNTRRRESLVKNLGSALSVDYDAAANNSTTAGTVGSPVGGGVAAAVAIRRSSSSSFQVIPPQQSGEGLRRYRVRSSSRDNDVLEPLSAKSAELGCSSRDNDVLEPLSAKSAELGCSSKGDKKRGGADEEEPEDTGVEDGDGDPSSKRRLKDVLKQLQK